MVSSSSAVSSLDVGAKRGKVSLKVETARLIITSGQGFFSARFSRSLVLISAFFSRIPEGYFTEVVLSEVVELSVGFGSWFTCRLVSAVNVSPS